MAVTCSFPFHSTTAVFFVVVTILIIHLPLSAAASDLLPGVSGIATLGLYPEPELSEYECRGTISECSVVGDAKEDDEMEFAMDSETNRRTLAATWYISYRALWRNVVPCSRRGASYYSCNSGAQANPYTRGCSRITHCRG